MFQRGFLCSISWLGYNNIYIASSHFTTQYNLKICPIIVATLSPWSLIFSQWKKSIFWLPLTLGICINALKQPRRYWNGNTQLSLTKDLKAGQYLNPGTLSCGISIPQVERLSLTLYVLKYITCVWSPGRGRFSMTTGAAPLWGQCLRQFFSSCSVSFLSSFCCLVLSSGY